MLQGKSVEEEAAKMVKSIFKCLICLNQCQLPGAACTTCFVVFGCLHCLEQWIESSTSEAKCPLCRTSADYAVIPVLREIANIYGQSVPKGNIAVENDASDSDTIPDGRGDEECRSDDDFDLAPVL